MARFALLLTVATTLLCACDVAGIHDAPPGAKRQHEFLYPEEVLWKKQVGATRYIDGGVLQETSGTTRQPYADVVVRDDGKLLLIGADTLSLLTPEGTVVWHKPVEFGHDCVFRKNGSELFAICYDPPWSPAWTTVMTQFNLDGEVVQRVTSSERVLPTEVHVHPVGGFYALHRAYIVDHFGYKIVRLLHDGQEEWTFENDTLRIEQAVPLLDGGMFAVGFYLLRDDVGLRYRAFTLGIGPDGLVRWQRTFSDCGLGCSFESVIDLSEDRFLIQGWKREPAGTRWNIIMDASGEIIWEQAGQDPAVPGRGFRSTWQSGHAAEIVSGYIQTTRVGLDGGVEETYGWPVSLADGSGQYCSVSGMAEKDDQSLIMLLSCQLVSSPFSGYFAASAWNELWSLK